MEDDDASSVGEEEAVSSQRPFPLPPLEPFHRFFPLDSAFFDEGNEDREHLTKLASLPPSHSSLPLLSSPPAPSSFFYCNAPHCESSFTSLSAFHAHYTTTHSHACVQCGARFSLEWWLRVHLWERHSPMWQVLKDRGEAVWGCLEEDCAWRGHSRAERRKHMTADHHWPKGFVFDERPARRRPLRPTAQEKPKVWRERRDGLMQVEAVEGERRGQQLEAAPRAERALPPTAPAQRPDTQPTVATSRQLPALPAPAAGLVLPVAPGGSALRFAPRQLQRPQHVPSRPSSSVHASRATTINPSTLPTVQTLDYREAEEVDSDEEEMAKAGKEHEELMMEVERKEAMAEEAAGDDALDEEMASAMFTLRGRPITSALQRRVPLSVMFGHRRSERPAG